MCPIYTYSCEQDNEKKEEAYFVYQKTLKEIKE